MTPLLSGLPVWYHPSITLPLGSPMAVRPIALVLRLPPQLHAALKRQAKAQTRSLNNLIVLALTAYVRKGEL